VIYQGDFIDILKTLDDEIIQCCVTSPPYWGLRDYGVDGQLGLEKTPEEYVEKLVIGFREVRRVLKDDGTLWLNLGDSYYNYRPGCTSQTKQTLNGVDGKVVEFSDKRGSKQEGLKEKDLCGIPWRVAFALQADGWYLRQDIIWAKPNPMPESVTDRCTKSHEYIFLLTKSARYYYDNEAVREQSVWDLDGQGTEGRKNRAFEGMKSYPTDIKNGIRPRTRKTGEGQDSAIGTKGCAGCDGYRNKRSVWTITTKPYKEAHFATFPEEIPRTCILAGSKKGDTILDPFSGAGTTGVVAEKLNRKYVGIELNPQYIKMAEDRIYNVQPLFAGLEL